MRGSPTDIGGHTMEIAADRILRHLDGGCKSAHRVENGARESLAGSLVDVLV